MSGVGARHIVANLSRFKGLNRTRPTPLRQRSAAELSALVTDAAKQMPSLRIKGNARIASGARQLRASAPLALGGTSRREMKEPRAGSER